MKKLLLSVLLGLSLILIAGCSEGKKAETENAAATEMKCEAGKCGDAMEKDEMPAQKESADGKCGQGKCGEN